MSPRKSTDLQEAPAPAPAGPYRKPSPDLYTVLLVIALIAVLIGILFLYLEMALYEFKLDGGPPLGMVSRWIVDGGQCLAASCPFQSLIPNP